MIISFILEQTLLKGFSTNRLQVLFLGSRLCGEIRTHNVKFKASVINPALMSYSNSQMANAKGKVLAG